MTVRITIDRIVLDGFDYGPRERVEFEAALRAELSLVAPDRRPGLPQVRAAQADGNAARTEHDGSAPRTGRAVARSVHARLPR